MPQIIGALIVGAAMGITNKQSTDKAKSAQRQQQEIATAQVQREDAAVLQVQNEKAQADERAREDVKRRKVGAKRSQTVRTSPLGIAGQADIAQKTLLGT